MGTFQLSYRVRQLICHIAYKMFPSTRVKTDHSACLWTFNSACLWPSFSAHFRFTVKLVYGVLPTFEYLFRSSMKDLFNSFKDSLLGLYSLQFQLVNDPPWAPFVAQILLFKLFKSSMNILFSFFFMDSVFIFRPNISQHFLVKTPFISIS